MSNDLFPFKETRYGFRWGALEIERVASIEGRGVIVSAKAGRKTLNIYVSPAGRSMRVYLDGSEMYTYPLASSLAKRQLEDTP